MKTQWIILFVTFVFSCTSLSLLIVSLATANWITGQATSTTNVVGGTVTVNYGLFTGIASRQVISAPISHELTMTCLFSENICAMSCQPTAEARETEVHNLLMGYPVATNCDGQITGFSGYQSGKATRDETTDARRKSFISAGLWVTTLLFLITALLFSFLSALFSVVNVIMNPVMTIFSVYGLYIWNGVTVCASAMSLILWGAQYGTTLKDNLAIQDTLRVTIPFDSTGNASLGYSFYLLLVSVVVHGINIGLLYWRQIVINREPPPVTINLDKPEVILLY